ncbi:MAG: DUF1727 domain-containing protein [Acidobacteria bacterium]|nr:DUF1727 domain-containing protein [Acidobacteriota bacterium]
MGSRLSPRSRLAVVAMKTVNRLSRQLGRGSGTVAGGRVALAINPSLLHSLSRRRRIVLVSGTNGKTTTTALVAAALGTAATNDTGSNMPPGHVAALAASNETFVVLETDEAWLPTVMAQVAPDVVVLLNLSRDQLDRSSEVRVVVEKWRNALHHTNAVVVANAADPLVAYAAVSQIGSKVIWVDAGLEWTGDARSCPQCTEPLDPLGEWHCACGFARPAVDFTVTGDLVGPRESVPLNVRLPGDFNRSNAAMAIVAAAQCGVPLALAAERVARVNSVAGRFTLRRYQGRTWRLLLAKNPAGVAALIDLVCEGRDVVVAINDQIADGLDPSWLYDAPFDRLRGRRVWCTGDRALDLATRLDYADVEYALVDGWAPQLEHDDVVDVVANYTAFAKWMEVSEPC